MLNISNSAMTPPISGETTQLAAIWPILPHLHRVHADTGDRKTDDGADDGVGGRYRPAAGGGDHQPDGGGQQRRQHAVDQ